MSIMHSEERNVQILIAVLKANNIKKVIVSPGATNISFVASIQNDPFFEVYSAVDERGAAYMACGLSAESGEPVVLSCTGSTASRNYLPGLTEAYHKKFPILAVTSSQEFSLSGHLSPQFIDRTEHPSDSVKLSVQVPIVRNSSDEWDCTIKINRAVLELLRNGGGPVHINLETSYSNSFTSDEIKKVRVIKRFFDGDRLPDISGYNRIAITVGAHKKWSDELTTAVDLFCENHNAAVIVDHSSGYWGKYRVLPTIVSTQCEYRTPLLSADLLIHIGEEHGDYYTNDAINHCGEVWRVSPDGEIKDKFRKLSNVFEMDEQSFFEYYASAETDNTVTTYYEALTKEVEYTYSLLPELAFSNIWVAQQITAGFPENASIHLGVSNTMRSWTFFDFPKGTFTLANTGCRGIDGAIATSVGMALSNPDKIHFAVMGDLTFFYGLNALGNRNIGANLRVILVNNGCGAEFNIYHHRAAQIFGGDKEEINKFVAAGGHYSSKSPDLVKHFSEDLGFQYLRATNKEEFKEIQNILLSPEVGDKPILCEIFTDTEGENTALKAVRSLRTDKTTVMKNKIKGILGESGVAAVKKLIR